MGQVVGKEENVGSADPGSSSLFSSGYHVSHVIAYVSLSLLICKMGLQGWHEDSVRSVNRRSSSPQHIVGAQTLEALGCGSFLAGPSSLWGKLWPPAGSWLEESRV